jgi:D-lactate dehydrogenase
MRIAVFDTHRYDRDTLDRANAEFGYELAFLEPRLTQQTASIGAGFDVVCSFVNDRVDREVLGVLRAGGVRLLALRSAGFNHVDLVAATDLAMPVVRVPEYSPHAVAEHAVALLLALNRRIHRAHVRVRDGNFSLEGLVGFDLHGKTVGLCGTGHIGSVAARIFTGFGCRVIAHDLRPSEVLVRELGVEYVSLSALYRESDVLSLHTPLTPATHHQIDAAAFAQMKPGVMLVNTGRGAVIDSRALIESLKSGRLGGAALDVYEEEEGVFFRDLSDRVLQDDVLARLLTFPNVLITAHQGFLTREALDHIATTTLGNVRELERGGPLRNEVRAADVLRRLEPGSVS